MSGAHRIATTHAGVALLLIALALAGCGQKGPLYLPDKRPAAVPAPIIPATATPAPTTDPDPDADKQAASRKL